MTATPPYPTRRALREQEHHTPTRGLMVALRLLLQRVRRSPTVDPVPAQELAEPSWKFRELDMGWDRAPVHQIPGQFASRVGRHAQE